MSKVTVSGLGFGTSDETLRPECEKYGTVNEVTIMRDRETGRSRGFAYVTFSTEQEANDAVSGLTGKEVDGQKVDVQLGEQRPRGGQGGYGGGRQY